MIGSYVQYNTSDPKMKNKNLPRKAGKLFSLDPYPSNAKQSLTKFAELNLLNLALSLLPDTKKLN